MNLLVRVLRDCVHQKAVAVVVAVTVTADLYDL